MPAYAETLTDAKPSTHLPTHPELLTQLPGKTKVRYSWCGSNDIYIIGCDSKFLFNDTFSIHWFLYVWTGYLMKVTIVNYQSLFDSFPFLNIFTCLQNPFCKCLLESNQVFCYLIKSRTIIIENVFLYFTGNLFKYRID